MFGTPLLSPSANAKHDTETNSAINTDPTGLLIMLLTLFIFFLLAPVHRHRICASRTQRMLRMQLAWLRSPRLASQLNATTPLGETKRLASLRCVFNPQTLGEDPRPKTCGTSTSPAPEVNYHDFLTRQFSHSG